MEQSKEITSRESILFGIIGFLLGIVLTLLFVRNAVNNNMIGMMRMMGINQKTDNHQEIGGEMVEHMSKDTTPMNDIVLKLKDKTGDDFDKEFTDLMIEHHQGAIDMANLAGQNAKHQEIKDLADDITSTQLSEIQMMRKWQKTWGY